jgi:leucyl aminopeptidase
MEFSIVNLQNRKKSELLVIPFWKGKKFAELAAERWDEKLIDFDSPIDAKDFKGKEGETLFLYPKKALEKRVLLLGLGEKEKITVERLRRSFATLAKVCRQKRIQNLNVVVPVIQTLTEKDVARGIAEGLLLANYVFEKLKRHTVKDESAQLIKEVALVGLNKKLLSSLKKHVEISHGVYLARDLVNGNADEITPQHLVEVAKNFAKKLPHVKAHILDKKRLEKEKMGLLLAVNRGSARDPALIILEYKGAPKSKDLTLLVGKGITYDTGGLNLKPTSSMETMKSDMGGAAAVLGVLATVARLKMKLNVSVVIPTTENCIGSKSYKPGDVYVSYSGKSVEITDTDAEGRLVLADAIAYAKETLKPSRIIDLATLTGAIVVALGFEATGLISNHDELADSLIQAGSETYERVWRLPFYDEYRDHLRSDIADMKNSGGRHGGAIIAGHFLHEFVGETPWAHLDIAGTAFLAESRRYHPKHGTGIGVRLLLEYLEQLESSQSS